MLLENFPCLTHFDWDNKRNTYSSIAAGFLFFFAFWLMIDTAVISDEKNWTNLYFFLTGFSVLSMIIVNAVSNSAVQGVTMDEGFCGTKGARLWLMFGFILSFACIVAGTWIMFANYVLIKGDHSVQPGVCLFLHTFLIFVSSLIYKFGRSEELWD